MKASPLAAATALSITLSLAGCASRTNATPGILTAAFDESGVAVSVRYSAPGNGNAASLIVSFAPDKTGFHLYSLTMPDDGVQGLGRPIRVAVSGRLAATGPLTADKPIRTIRPAGLDVDLPVYPDGPVTVTMPVSVVGGSSTTAHVAISYAACSAMTCLAPVTRKPVEFTIQ